MTNTGFTLLLLAIIATVAGCIWAVPLLEHWSCQTFGQCDGLTSH